MAARKPTSLDNSLTNRLNGDKLNTYEGWRSPVAHSVRDAGVAGSNPVPSTNPLLTRGPFRHRASLQQAQAAVAYSARVAW